MTNVFGKIRLSRGVNSDTGKMEWKFEPDKTPRALTPLIRNPGPHVNMDRKELQQLYDVIGSDLRGHSPDRRMSCKNSSYDEQTCLSDCPHLVFVRMQKLKLTTITVPRHRCSYYDQDLVYVMGLGPDRCLECMEAIV